MKQMKQMKQIIMFSTVLLILLSFNYCTKDYAGQQGTASTTTSPGEPPTKAPDVTVPRNLVLYYPSYARYSLAPGSTSQYLTADLYLNGISGQYAFDEFVPSFCVIGDGVTVNGAEPAAWSKDKNAFDDVFAWAGLNWTLMTGSTTNYTLVYANGSNLGSGNILSALNSTANMNVPYGLAIGGWPKNDNPLDPLRTGGFDRIGASANDADLTAYVNDLNSTTSGMAAAISRPANAIHIDYEFPTAQYQADGLVRILTKLKALNTAKFKIYIALGPSIANHLSKLDFTTINNLIDGFEIMSYDYMGIWSGITGHHTCLYSSVPTSNTNANLDPTFCADAEVNYLISKGVPSTKIKIGVAAYGRVWSGVTSIPTTITSTTVPNFPASSTYTGPTSASSSLAISQILASSVVKYNDLVTQILKSNESPVVGTTSTVSGWEYDQDATANAEYLVNRSLGLFISYDGAYSIAQKAAYCKSKNLGGVIVWDATGVTNTNFLKTLHGALK